MRFETTMKEVTSNKKDYHWQAIKFDRIELFLTVLIFELARREKWTFYELYQQTRCLFWRPMSHWYLAYIRHLVFTSHPFYIVIEYEDVCMSLFMNFLERLITKNWVDNHNPFLSKTLQHSVDVS